MATIPTFASPALRDWAARGRNRRLAGHDVFTVDIPPSSAETRAPVLVLHGFPTSSFDFHLVADRLAVNRRVLLFDMVGYGLSAKPDAVYTLALQADVAQALVADAGIDRLCLVTHDMGDTVGGELLARHAEGTWPVEVAARVVTNGSIYIEMANLTAGQKMLLSLPDAMLPGSLDPSGATLAAALRATFSPQSRVEPAESEAAAEAILHGGGDRLLPRTIRYIEERRADQSRFTGALEEHSSPLTILWGRDDPIAVVSMAERLHGRRPDSTLTVFDGVGHYPMVEAPDAFAAALVAALDPAWR